MLTFGNQRILTSQRQVNRVFGTDEFGHVMPNLITEDVFRKLGFSEIRSLDVSDYEHPSILFDLNSPETPPELVGQFDTVMDIGTLEHVFHVPNALANICRMTKRGGRIIIQVPSSNALDHGFYSISPTLLTDYFQANGATVETALIIRSRPGKSTRVEIFKYDASWDVGIGSLDNFAYETFIVARLPFSPVPLTVPQQSHYRRAWVEKAPWQMVGRSGVRKWLDNHRTILMAVRAAVRATRPKRQPILTLRDLG